MKYTWVAAAAVFSFIAGGPAWAQGTKPAPPTVVGVIAPADATFAKDVARDGMAEVAHGQLASKKASNADVKQFAARMVADHGKANDELKAWATANKISLPAEMGAQHEALQAKLTKLGGVAFERSYMMHMVAAHAKAVGVFRRASKTAKNADLKAWAARTLPTLEEHLKMAREVSSKLSHAGRDSAAKKTAKE